MDDLDFGATIKGFASGQKVFNRYTLKKILGRGGMGVVWLAQDSELDREVALKFLPEIVALDPEALGDLKRETRRNLALTHENIVRINDFVSDGRTAAISMEYVDGATLSALKLEKSGRVLTLDEIRPWLGQLCDALGYAHGRAKVVHRDLKPANLMLTKTGDLKITDFGIARGISDSVSRVSAQAAGSSGTPVYMSPQQMMGEKPAVTDDIYALGATLYELLTGKPPFYSGNVFMQVQNKMPPSLAERRKELEITSETVPAHWERTIAACLAKEAKDRPQNMGEVAELLGITTKDQPSPRMRLIETKSAKVGGVALDNPVVERLDSRTNSGGQVKALESTRSTKAPLYAGFAAAVIVLGGLGWYFGVHVPAQERLAEPVRNKAEISTRPVRSEPTPGPQAMAPGEKSSVPAAPSPAVLPAVVETPKNPQPEQPWENSLGMIFKPVPGTKVLFSIWETRVRDYRTFLSETGNTWNPPDYPQGPTHPVCSVSWNSAQSFCQWLTKRERRAGQLTANQRYRLPTDAEWSTAVGLSGEPDGSPSDKQFSETATPYYPWGKDFPPPVGFGNYRRDVGTDDYDFSSPVGTFPANQFGLFDLSGNAWEWCEDLLYGSAKDQTARTMRGSAFYSDLDNLATSARNGFTPEQEGGGFRVVLETGATEVATHAFPEPYRRRDAAILEANLSAGRDMLARLNNDAAWRELPDGLRLKVVRPGTGAAVHSLSRLGLRYVIKDTTGKVLINTEWTGGTLDTMMKNLVPGIAEGLRYVRAGGAIELFVPPQLAYGDASDGVFPPGATLDATIELLAVDGEAAPPAGKTYAPVLAVTSELRPGQALNIVDLQMQFQPIPAGSFVMGSATGGDGDERPVTKVKISRPFWLGRTEVTQGQWHDLMGTMPSAAKGEFLPVNQVSWDDAMAYCGKLTARERAANRLPAGYVFTLPTEAQWEYACRAGSTQDVLTREMEASMWHDENSHDEPHPVGQKPANAWGLHDIHGNVFEWCRAWMGVYPGGLVADPVGEATRTLDAFRGGAYENNRSQGRPGSRGHSVTDYKASNVGFRVALVPLN